MNLALFKLNLGEHGVANLILNCVYHEGQQYYQIFRILDTTPVQDGLCVTNDRYKILVNQIIDVYDVKAAINIYNSAFEKLKIIVKKETHADDMFFYIYGISRESVLTFNPLSFL